MCTTSTSRTKRFNQDKNRNEDYLDDKWQEDKFVLRYLDYRESNYVILVVKCVEAI